MRKLLLADDEIYVTSVLSQRLGPVFDQIIVASDGQEALALALEDRPSLIISDYQMPVVDGFQLACRLFENPATASIPMILLTARGHLLKPEEIARTNIVRMIPKPFAARDVLAAVESILFGESERRVA